MMFGLSETLSRIIVAAIFLALIVAFFSFRSCTSAREEAAQARQDAKGASAYADAAKDAVATVSARSDEEAALKDVVAQAAKEISDAEGSDQAIPPAARAAALRAACRLPNYRDEPACTL